MAAPRITVLQLDPQVPVDRFGGWLLGAVLRNVPVWRKPLPPNDALGDGVVVLGGLASIDDHEPWMGPLKRLMVDAVVSLPTDAVELARSTAYAHQAFRIGSALGVQFHPEASPELMTSWEEMQQRDPVAMRRRMRLVDADTSRNGALVAQGLVQTAREYAECAQRA